MNLKIAPALLCMAALAACDVQDGQYATASSASTKAPQTAPVAPVAPEQVQIIEGTPTQSFTVLGPLDVTANKLTAFHPNPTRDAALGRLREAAAKLGADAVINVTVSDVKVVPLSWGARQATGTAVKFQ